MASQPSFSGPLYQQVHALLLGRITSGEWRKGTPIPGETDLSRELGVSVGTIRKALDLLARDRIVVRERGRGTFIKEVSESWPAATRSFRLCDNEGRPLEAEVRLLSVTSDRPDIGEMTALRIARQSSMRASVLHIRREWRSNGRLICLETVTVDEARFPKLGEFLLEGGETLFPVYGEAFRTFVGRTLWSFRSIAAASVPEQGLAAAADGTLLHCRRIAFDQKDLPFEISDQILGFASESYQIVQ